MHELEVLLSKMEHLSYHVESLLEQAAKKELNYREFLCMALQQEWNGRHQRGMESRLKQARLPWVKRWSSSTLPSSRASIVRLSGNWLVWRSWSAAKTLSCWGLRVSEKLIFNIKISN
ncbi:Putative transposase [Escherichia coli]|nr:Putative transposase [Escherichia coli]